MSELVPPQPLPEVRDYCITFVGKKTNFYFHNVTSSAFSDDNSTLHLVDAEGRAASVNMAHVLYVTSAPHRGES